MIKIEVDDRAIKQAIGAALSISKNPKPMFREIGAALVDSTKLRFKDSTAPSGQAWAPLSALTISRRRGGGKGAKPLLDTGRLRNSITMLAGNDFVEVGTNVRYAAIHQFGGAIDIAARSQQLFFRQGKNGQVGNRFVKKKRSNFAQWATIGAYQINIPARPFLGLSAEDRQEILEIARHHYEQALSGKR